MFAELRAAVRSLQRHPVYATLAIGSVALALGLSISLLAVLDALAHPPVAARNHERVVEVTFAMGEKQSVMTPGDVAEMLREARSFSGVTTETAIRPAIERAPEDQRVLKVVMVPPAYFSVLQIPAVAGRLCAMDAEASVDIQSVIISVHIWKHQFASTPDLRGSRMTINDRSYAVIGVVGGSTSALNSPDAWLCEPSSRLLTGRQAPTRTFARLRDGVTFRAAQAELSVFARRLERISAGGADADAHIRASIEPTGRSPFLAPAFILVFGGAAGLLLAIGCANVAYLILTRSMSRRGELVIRAALGASRVALIRQLLIESAIIGFVGTLMSILASYWLITVVALQLPDTLNDALQSRYLITRVLEYGVVSFVVTALVCGLFPALLATRGDASLLLKEFAGNTTTRSTRRYSRLLVVEVAVSLTLLACVGMLVESLRAVRQATEGIQVRGLYSASLDLSRVAHAVDTVGDAGPSDRQTAVGIRANAAAEALSQDAADMRAQAAADAGLRAIETANQVSAAALYLRASVPKQSIIAKHGRRLPLARYTIVSNRFFRTVDLSPLQGRDFRTDETGVDRVAIVDEVLARRLWPTGSALGRELRLGAEATSAPWIRVVGVSRAVRLDFDALDSDAEGHLYVLGNAAIERGTILLMRSRLANAHTPRELEDVIRTAAPSIGVSFVRSFEAALRRRADQQQQFAAIFFLLSAIALAQVALGLFSATSYAVSERTREIAIRVALGASSAMVLRLVFRDGLRTLAQGCVLGTLLAWIVSRLVASLLFGVEGLDAAVLAFAYITLSVVVLGASWLPARRAITVDAVDALRAT